jgi:hypothetical protein
MVLADYFIFNMKNFNPKNFNKTFNNLSFYRYRLECLLIKYYNTQIITDNTQKNKNDGFFASIIINAKTNPRTVFIYYDNKLKQITHSKLYLGKAHYREYNRFIIKVIEFLVQNGHRNMHLLASKHYISKSVYKFAELHKINLEGYNRYVTPSKIYEIKSIIKD